MAQRGNRARRGPRSSAGRPVRFEALEPRLLMAGDSPTVTRIEADNRGLVVLTFSRELNVATVNPGSFQLFTAGADGLLGTADDAAQSATVTYDNATKQVRVQSTLAANTRYKVRVNGSTVKGTNDVLLDGEFNGAGVATGNGVAGGDLVFFTRQPVTRIARFTTISGIIDVELLSGAAPLTVQNFLNYANSGVYDSTFFHRLVNQFVIQGGGFTGTPPYNHIPQNDPVLNEPGVTNGRGTIAMAKFDGDPNSATNEFFFNLKDNRGTPPNGLDFQNGGFTVFGRITDAAGLAVMDALAQFQTFSATNTNGAFGSLPVRDRAAVQARGGQILPSDLVAISRIALMLDVSGEPAQQLPTEGSFVVQAPNGTASVQFFDVTGSGGLGSSSFARVVFGPGNSIISITLRDPSPTAPVGIRITGATSVGAILDQRTSPGHAISFILSDVRIGSISVSGPIQGFNLNGFLLPGGETLDDDLDGDGSSSDKTAIFIKQGLVNSLLVSGDLLGDVVAPGGIASVQVRGRTSQADFQLGGGTPGFLQTVFNFNMVDSVSISSPVHIVALRATDWQNTGGSLNTVRAPSIGSILVTGNRLTGAPGDFRASVNMTGSTVANRFAIGSVNAPGLVGKGAWKAVGNVGTIVAGNGGFQNWSLDVTGNVVTVRTPGSMSGVTIDLTGRMITLMAGDFVGGVFRAEAVQNFWLTGNRTLGLAGDFNGEMTLSRTQINVGPTLGSLMVPGSMTGSTLNISGNTSSFVVRGEVRDTTVAAAREIASITLGAVTNTRFTASTRLGLVSVTRWDGGRLQAPTITRLVTLGNLRAGMTGDFLADITANTEVTTMSVGAGGTMRSNLTAGRVGTLLVDGNVENSIITLNRAFTTTSAVKNADSITVRGSMNNSEIRSRGNVGAITLGAMDSSGVYVGAPTNFFGLPDSAAGFNTEATLQRISINGIPRQSGPFMSSSYVVAGKILNATVQLPARENFGSQFGLAANTMGSVYTRFSDGVVIVPANSHSRAFGDYQVRIGFVPPTA
ncbi:MAG TPA: peptidylprolyl isomerase [Phycisphaerales bacterium]|nr:peptidylprolyl isomerase [Phycisphaerales bacterium]